MAQAEHATSEDPRDLERELEERRPVEEAGGGVSEGFEQSEEDLIENAEHGDTIGHPLGDRFPPEEEGDKDVTHGEADGPRTED